METILLIFVMSLGAAFVQRVSGFGFGIFIMTVLPFVLPSYGEATALSGMLALVTSLFITLRLRRFIPWRRLLPILLTFLAVSALAVMAVASAPEAVLKRVLGVVLIVASVWFFCFSDRVQVRPTLPVQFSLGTLSGLMGGFFGMQGPPAVLYFVNSEPDKDHYLAQTQAYFFIGNLMMTMARAYNGFFTTSVAMGYVYGIVGVVIGNMMGAWVFRHITGPLLKYIIYAYIGISGLTFLLEA